MPFNPDNPNESAMEDELASGASPHTDTGQEEGTPFIVGANTGEDEAIGDDASSKRSHSGTILIVLVIVIAGVGLFSMRTLSRVTAAGNVNNDLEATIEAFLNDAGSGRSVETETNVTELVERNQQVLEVIRKSNLGEQISISDPQRNPFIIESQQNVDSGEQTDPGEQADAIREQKRTQRRAELKQAIEQIKIKSILMGSQPLVNINNSVLTEGDVLILNIEGATFRITKIQNSSVTVEGTDKNLDVSVSVDLALKRR